MTAKSIIEVDLQSESFKEFLTHWNKFQTELGKQPSKWDAVNAYVEKVAAGEAAATEEIKDQNEALDEQATERRKDERARSEAGKRERSEERKERADKKTQEKATREADKARVAAEREAAKIAGERERATKRIVGNVRDAAVGMAKWAVLGGALGLVTGAAGLWGLDRFAAGVGDSRRSALGVGTTTGRQQAFGVNLGSLVDPSQLARVADAQGSLADRWAFTALGIRNPQGRDPADLAAAMAPRAKSIFERGGQTQEYAEAMGLTKFYSMEELRRLANTSMEEVKAVAAAYKTDAREMAVRDAVSVKWQELSKQLDRGKWSIKAALVDGLAPLAPQFAALSEKFADFIRNGLQSDKFKKFVDEAGDKLVRFGDYLASPAFEYDMDRFMKGAGELADNVILISDAIVKALQALHIIPQSPQAVDRANTYVSNMAGDKGAPTAARSRAMRALLGMGLSKEHAAGWVSQFEAESGLNPTAVGDGGRAYGLGQWHPDRQALFRKWAGFDIRDPRATFEKQIEFANWELHQRPEGKLFDQKTRADEASRVLTLNYERPANAAQKAVARSRVAEALVRMKFDAAPAINDNVARGSGTLAELRRLRASGASNLAGLLLGLHGSTKTRAQISEEIRAVSGSTGIGANDTVSGDPALARIAAALEAQGRGSVPQGVVVKVDTAPGANVIASAAQVAR